MFFNNRNTVAYGTTMDKARKAKENLKASQNVSDDRTNAIKEDILKTLEILYPTRSFIRSSEHTVSNSNKWNKKNISGAITEVNKKLEKLHELNFFELISNKSQTGEELMYKTIKVNHANQKSSANESLNTWNEAYNNFLNIKENGGSVFAWDLETTGGKDLNGIWRPNSITEFAIQEYNYSTGRKDPISVLVGITDKKQAQATMDKIEAAIKAGTLEQDNELFVTAMRMAKYGSDEFSMEKVANKGYYKATSFPKENANDYKNIDRIKKGFDRLLEAGNYAQANAIDGVRADHYYIAQTMNNVMQQVNHGTAMLTGFNDSAFDFPILNAMLGQWDTESNGALANLFNNNIAAVNFESKGTLDILGGTRLYTDYNSINSLYPGASMKDLEKVRGQEYIAKAHLGEAFDKYRPHMAEDDVSALLDLIVNPSVLAKDNQSYVDYINKGIANVNYQSHELSPGQHVLRAKKRQGQDSFTGKGYLNFAQSKKHGTILSSDNHMIGIGDAALEANGGILKEGFNLGFGVNKGSFYDILDIKQVNVNDEMRKTIAGLAPEYGGNKLFHVQLGMVVDEAYEDTRLGDLVQNFIFKSEKELNAFLSSNFDVVAQRDGSDVNIVSGMEKYFDMRQLKDKKGNANLQEVIKNDTDLESFLYAIKANNEKLLVSRANNNIFGEKSFEKITKALNLKNQLEESLGISIEGKDISLLMSEKVAKGQMPLGLNNEQVIKAKDIISRTLEYNSKNTKRLLDSSVDNMATGITMLSSYEKMLSAAINTLNQSESFTSQTSEAKQEIFSRVINEVKRQTADHMYNDPTTSARMQLGNVKLISSFEDFKNLYEIDYSKIIKGDRINFIDIANPENLANVLKIDLSNNNSVYGLINTAVNSVYGDLKRYGDDIFKRNAMEKMFTMLNEDNDLKNTKAFKDIRKRYDFNGRGFGNNDFHQDDIAQEILQAMREVKSHNATKGIINTKQAYMKSLEGHKAFTNALNSSNVIDNILPSVVDDVVNNFKHTQLNKEFSSAQALAEQLVNSHYMNFSANKSWGDAKQILYKNTKKDLQDYIADVLYSASSIDGTNISIQENGALMLSRNGRYESLDNLIPKVRLNEETGTMFTELGSMKIQLSNVLGFKSSGIGITGYSNSTLGLLNEYSLNKRVRSVAGNNGADDAIDTLLAAMRSITKDISQLSTINGFGGNDIDSNYAVSVSNIKNVLVDLFSDEGRSKSVIHGMNFTDKTMMDFLTEKANNLAKSGKELESLDAETVRVLVKDVQHIIDAIIDFNPASTTEDFKKLGRNLSFTGSEKKVSDLVGMQGYRPTNSIFGFMDNTQRPPITQSGNAYNLRVDGIPKSSGVTAGNIISNAMMDERMLRDVSGIGKTTTDVMMNISYVDNSALKILIESNFNNVMQANNIGLKTEEAKTKAFQYIRDTYSTFEQERIMDARTHEAVYGLRTANTQRLSKNFEILKPIDGMSGEEFTKQAKALLDHRGTFTLAEDGSLTFSSSTGKLLKRGESALKWKGFADLDNDFSSKMDYGVFNFNYYKADGTKLKDSEINAIIKANRSSFTTPNGAPINQYELSANLEKLLTNKYGTRGQFAIEDISAIGYVKTMTGGAEKGMTDIVYASTGMYNEQVRDFFKKTNTWDIAKSRVLTEEGTDALIGSVKKSIIEQALKSSGIGSVENLKSLMREERYIHSKTLFDTILDGKAHMFANDGVAKHQNIGQMYQGTIAKAIDLLGKEYGDNNKAVSFVANLMGQKEYGFIKRLNLESTNIEERSRVVKAINKDGRLFFEDNFITKGSDTVSFDSNTFKSFLERINNELTTEKIISEDGKFGSHLTDSSNTIIGTNTRENVKYVRDAETQTGNSEAYLNLKNKVNVLKREEIDIKSKMVNANVKQKATLQTQLDRVRADLYHSQDKLRAFTDISKDMRFGDQELSIIERIALTDAHADQIQSLIDKGELSSDVIDNSGFKNYVTYEDGKYKLKDDFTGGAFNKLTKQLKDQQYYNRYTEELLTEADLKNAPHLRNMYEYAKKHNFALGKDSAEKQYQINLAQKATWFNDGSGNTKDLLEAGFERRGVKDVIFNAEGIVDKNLLIDLGEEFGPDRYLALPGTGINVADEEIKSKAQSAFAKLQYTYDEYSSYAGYENDTTAALKQRILNQRDNVIESISSSVYGKHGLKHKASSIEVDAVSYRLKASGFISDAATDELIEEARKRGVNIERGTNALTSKAQIDGRSIADWERNGDAFFDYKFVSREQMNRMGYFKDETLRKFEFLKDGVSKEDAISEMEEFLRVHGTFDITDRYPNTRSGSLNATRVFMDDTLQNNQSKVSIPTMLKANADHDGDSYSSFRIEILDKEGNKVDGAMYALAKLKGGRDSGFIDADVYDEFENIQKTLTGLAITENKYWQKEGVNKIAKDLAKNIDLANPDNMVVVPGGKSILGQVALSNIDIMPTLKEFNSLEASTNEVLELAKGIAGDKFDVKIVESKDPAGILDEALSVLSDSGKYTSEQMAGFENIAMKRVQVDKYAQEMMAKTGLAATGSVNLSLNAVKLAAHFGSQNVNDKVFTDYVWDVLDTAEQQVISSKKMQGGSYTDGRITQFKDAMKGIFNNKKEPTSQDSIDGLITWLNDFGDNIFEISYNKMGSKVLSKEQLADLDTITDINERTVKGTQYMREKFGSLIKDMSEDGIMSSFVSSIEGSGRNSAQIAELWRDGRLSAAAATGISMTAREQGMSGFGNEKVLENMMIERAEKRLIQNSNELAAERLKSNTATAKASNQAMQQVVETLGNAAPKSSGGMNGIAIGALGLAAGLLVGGYASGNPLNDKQASEVSQEMQTMSVPEFMDQQGGYVTGNSQQGYIVNIKADTKKGRKHMEKIMAQAAQASVGGAVSVNMNLRNIKNNDGVTDKDIEDYINRVI